jgi:hypothetical protein
MGSERQTHTTLRQPSLRFRRESRKSLSCGAAYGVRSAVTRRACLICVGVPEPARRRQAGSKFGQACCEQSRPIGRISSRSPLASTRGTLASTSGAKPGSRARAVATSAAIATAETALIMNDDPHVTGPWPLVDWLTPYKVPVSGWLLIARKWFHSRAVLFHRPVRQRNRAGTQVPGYPRKWFSGR